MMVHPVEEPGLQRGIVISAHKLTTLVGSSVAGYKKTKFAVIRMSSIVVVAGPNVKTH